MEGTDSGGHRERQRMAETVQQVSKNVRRSVRPADEKIIPGSGKAKNVIWGGHISRASNVVQIVQNQKRRSCST